MKKCVVAITFWSALLVGVTGSGAAQSRANFSGTWALDTKKTGEVPPDLKSYTLTVKQDEQQISFEAKVDGELNPPGRDQSGHSPNLSTAETPSHATASSGATSVTGDAHTAGGNSRPIVLARGRALATVIRRVTCPLDGREVSREAGGISPGRIRHKAQWRRNAKTLEVTLARDFDIEGTLRTATIKELWDLAEGGKVLKIKRTVNLLAGWDETTLVFNRQ